MQHQKLVRAAAAGAIVLGIGLFFMLKPRPGSVTANPPASDAINLRGVVRDFPRTHPDFAVVPSHGYGHYAGCVSTNLGSGGGPVFVGEIADTRTITNFDITQGGVVSSEPFAAMVTLLGAAIENSDYHVPVTTKVHVGNPTFEMFGAFVNAVGGNVNDDQSVTGSANPGSNPRRHVFPTVFPASTAITVTGRSWERDSGDGRQPQHWHASMTYNSHQQSQQVRVLRDGDPVPDVAGFNNQSSIAEYVRDFVDAGADTIRLLDNQAIYLFELGTTNMNSTAADFQDLVVLVTLARDPAYLATLDVFGRETAASNSLGSGYKVQTQWRDRANRPMAPHLFENSSQDACATAVNDIAGSRGPTSTGGIHSAATFQQWFRDELGVNLSAAHTITLRRDSQGVYEYSTTEFHPIDGQLLGNDGEQHNHHFTYSVCAQFTYESCGRQFFEFAGSDDAWLFVDGKLVMDRGGVMPATSQYVDMDRLGLTDGRSYSVCFFYAQRQSMQADFHMRTNIFMGSQAATPSVSGGFD